MDLVTCKGRHEFLWHIDLDMSATGVVDLRYFGGHGHDATSSGALGTLS
jgi:hypothetical protein